MGEWLDDAGWHHSMLRFAWVPLSFALISIDLGVSGQKTSQPTATRCVESDGSRIPTKPSYSMPRSQDAMSGRLDGCWLPGGVGMSVLLAVDDDW